MDTKKILAKELSDFCMKALLKQGMDRDDALITSRVLVETDMYGTFSHGTKNLRMYIEKIKAEGINSGAKPDVIFEDGAFALMDGKDAIGMVAAYKGMEKAIDIASKSRVSYVGIKNSCHFGAAGYYANMAANQGMIGIAMSNTDPNMSILGSKGSVIGNSPFSYAVPDGKGSSIFLDIAMSATAALKVSQAKKEGKPIPNTWIIDEEGLPTTDPSVFPEKASLQPMASHKGYGLSMMVEVLTGVLLNGGFLGEVKSWNQNLSSKNMVSHAFIVIKIADMIESENFNNNIKQFTSKIKEADKSKGTSKILLPGEIENEVKSHSEKEGIQLPEDVVASLEQLATESDLIINWME